eukprot:CAMPEP_0197239058 /NCGR_PEP_ID=MMETSP1429-20130617/5557_1 /TAXON_ID=49237 /ORGANISM="Chaetoceros  sp., Strain UNC1202" /LENGTH=309 /DNA_ID=CAMNT_0042698373 /DNA_START=13 /DNA_END=942 /DNA_ORIENTATION=+
MKLSIFSVLAVVAPKACEAFTPTRTSAHDTNLLSSQLTTTASLPSSSALNLEADRRQILQMPALAILSSLAAPIAPLPAFAAEGTKMTGAADGNLPDLPTEASRSYLQYRIALQIAADYYIFDLQPKLTTVDDWGDINQLFQTNNNRGQGQPNKIERDYVNPMRILGLSMPPDEAEDMRTAQFKFEKAMSKISKAVSGVRRDLPVEIDANAVTNAQQGWEDGRVALNDFFAILNSITGLNEMVAVPKAGPEQNKEYGRSARRYNELMKKTKLCQNRGGPALSQAWGQLMISGYMQDSCGIPDLDTYFYQ